MVAIGDALRGAATAGEVVFDNPRGVEAVMRHLHGLGHRRIAVLTPSIEATDHRPTETLVRHWAETLDLDCTVLSVPASLDAARAPAMRLLARSHRPTAVYCQADSIAYAVYHACAELGLEIPADVSVCGFDDHPMSRVVHPPLTSVDWGVDVLARVATGFLLDALDGRPAVPARHDAAGPARPRLDGSASRLTCSDPWRTHDRRHRPRDRPRRARRRAVAARAGCRRPRCACPQNNLDPDVAEDPANLVVYGGTGRAARLVAGLPRDRRERCGGSATTRRCSCRAGRPVGVFRTHAMAPRVLLANSLLVPDWADWATFRRARGGRADDVRPDDRRLVDLHRHPGHRAGHLRDVRRRRGAALRRHACRDALVLTAGCGGMGGAQPLAVTMLDGVCLIADVDHDRLRRRVRDALPRRRRARPRLRAARGRGGAGAGRGPLDRRRRQRRARSSRPLLRRGVLPDVVTDQTSAHDPLGGYVPTGSRSTTPPSSATRDPERLRRRSRATSMARHCAAMVEFQDARRGRLRLRQQPAHRRPSAGGFERAFAYPGFVPAYVRPLFCRGDRPVPLGGARRRARRHRRHRRRACASCSPRTRGCSAGSTRPRERIAFQGLPARICWLGYGERHRAGLRFNELVRERRGARRRS